MKRKIAAFALCTLMLASVLTACTDKESIPRDDEESRQIVTEDGDVLTESRVKLGGSADDQPEDTQTETEAEVQN